MPARIITLDGPAWSGKSTNAKLVAKILAGIALDSGSFYRIIADQLLYAGIDPLNEAGVAARLHQLKIYASSGVAERVNGRHVSYTALKRPEIQAIVSAVSRNPFVRDFVNDQLRQYADTVDEYIICEGRDAGHVIFPNAERKLFLWAPAEVRASRGNETIAQVEARDHSDMTTKGEGNLLSVDEARSLGYRIINAALSPEAVLNACIEAITGELL